MEIAHSAPTPTISALTAMCAPQQTDITEALHTGQPTAAAAAAARSPGQHCYLVGQLGNQVTE